VVALTAVWAGLAASADGVDKAGGEAGVAAAVSAAAAAAAAAAVVVVVAAAEPAVAAAPEPAGARDLVTPGHAQESLISLPTTF
jgi:copper(I)-binding protein